MKELSVFFFTGALSVFWILHFIVLCFRAYRNVIKLLYNVLAENYVHLLFRQCALLQNSQTYTYTHNSLQFPAEMNARGSKTPLI